MNFQMVPLKIFQLQILAAQVITLSQKYANDHNMYILDLTQCVLKLVFKNK